MTASARTVPATRGISLAGAFLVLSGIAALTYQVVWVRLLSLSMGSTSASVATVLAAFFLGLAAGSWLAERLTRRRVDDLGVYVALEVLIGVSGAALLPALLNLDAILAYAPAFGTSTALKFGLTIALLSVPTVCMGATFPVLAGIFVRRQDAMGRGVAQLYALNTAGAVLGAALSGFVLIPRYGLDGAVWIAVALNAVVAALAALARGRLRFAPVEPASEQPTGTSDGAAGAALVVLFATGFVSIAAEVGWTKYLAIFTGTTIYGFSAILTVFLVGIALGSWAMRSRLDRIRSPRRTLALGLLALGAALLLSRSGLALVPSILERLHGVETAGMRNLLRYGSVFALLLPPTFLFGALYPLTLTLYCGTVGAVRARIGRAYAINTFASILGSVAAGFWLIPRFGTDALLLGLALAMLALPLALARPVLSIGWRGPLAAVVLAVAGFFLPGIDYARLIESVGYGAEGKGSRGGPEFLYLREGKAGVISVVTWDGRVAVLQSNGLKESLIAIEKPSDGPMVEALLAIVPYLLHAEPRSAFCLGFGGGMTVRALTYTDVEVIRVVELEPNVVAAVEQLHGGPIPCLGDPRVELSYNDARNTLLVEGARYDLIVSQPSHPWIAGAGNLFTREFFAIVHSRLNEGGVFGQWVNLFHMDATTLRSIMQGFFGEFSHGFVCANPSTGDLLLFGSDRPTVLDLDRADGRLARLPELDRYLDEGDVEKPSDLLWYFWLSRAEAVRIAGDAVANSDTNLLSEVRLAALEGAPPPDEDPLALLVAWYTFDVGPSLVPVQVSRALLEAGRYCITWGDLAKARVALLRLQSVDPDAARTLDAEIARALEGSR